ncbi:MULTISPECIES: hypothetical protein [unclassified Acinetobacter]|uniref:hypothetical protein n=1 Tax=unclassified Acinetobacter TaxID=196816 RepID=UPI0015D226EF|nr:MULTISPECIES: hypothetical protein [unclassified Acinetobacter]UUS62510.1 hypothetical protein MST17_16790 [Acinetobacter sp. YH16056_T]
MIDKKVEYAITSLAFHETKNILAASSYSTDTVEIFKVENNALKSEKELTLKGGNNPLNSLIFTNNFLVCIDDFSKQISKINYKTNEIVAIFSHEHSRGFESIDCLKDFEDPLKNLFVLGSKKIHPPTIKKLGLVAEHQNLENIFLLDNDLVKIKSTSIPGNVIQTKFNVNKKTILVISKFLNGTTLYVLDFNLNILNKVHLSNRKSLTAFLEISNNSIFIVLQINQDGIKSEFIKLSADNLKIIESHCYEDSKFSANIKEYINSIFCYKSYLITELYCREKDKSELNFYNLLDENLVKKIDTFGFMESMAFNQNLMAWSENNKIKVIEIS